MSIQFLTLEKLQGTYGASRIGVTAATGAAVQTIIDGINDYVEGKVRSGYSVLGYQNRSIETAQVMEELVEMAKKFRQAASRGESLGLTDDEVRFYDALANNESAVKELTDETLKKIAQELTDNLRRNITVDWSQRESVRANLRLMVKRILRKYKYPPDSADAAIDLVLQQAEALGESWS